MKGLDEPTSAAFLSVVIWLIVWHTVCIEILNKVAVLAYQFASTTGHNERSRTIDKFQLFWGRWGIFLRDSAVSVALSPMPAASGMPASGNFAFLPATMEESSHGSVPIV